MTITRDALAHLGPFEEARQRLLRAGASLIDLTETNPTVCELSSGLTDSTDTEAADISLRLLGEAAKKYFENRLYRPDAQGLLSARRAIAEYYLADSGLVDSGLIHSGQEVLDASRKENNARNWRAIRPEQIFITASTSESYALIGHLLKNPHGEKQAILSANPNYPLFEHLFEYHGFETVHYALEQGKEGNWQVDQTSMQRALESTKEIAAVVVVSPHNPTGHVFSSHAVSLPQSLPIISDEVFGDFCWNGGRQMVADGFRDNPVFTLGGISKSCGFPDLKVGWIVCNEVALERYGSRLEFLNDAFLSANQLSQELLPHIFTYGKTFRKLASARVKENFHFLEQFQADYSDIRFVIPEAGPFIVASLPWGLDDEKFAIDALNRGVVVHPGYFYGIESNGPGQTPRAVFACLLPPSQFQAGIHLLLNR